DFHVTGVQTCALPISPPAAEAAVDAPRSAAGELDQLRAERDEYLRALQRLKAEFSNYRKRMIRQQTQVVAEATEDLVRRLLPVQIGRASCREGVSRAV